MAKEHRTVIEDLLNQMEEILDSAMAVPFSDKVWVDKNAILELVQEIKDRLPKEMEDARMILVDRERILEDAEKKRRSRLEEIEIEREEMVNENEITRLAYEEAEGIVKAAQKAAKDMKMGANEYADDILFQLDEQMKRMGDFTAGFMDKIMAEYQDSMRSFNEALEQKRVILQNNRKELNINRISNEDQQI